MKSRLSAFSFYSGILEQIVIVKTLYVIGNYNFWINNHVRGNHGLIIEPRILIREWGFVFLLNLTNE